MYPSIKKELERIKDLGLMRSITTIHGPQGPRVRVDGRDVVLLCSNNYLGLASHPDVKRAMKEAVERFGAGTGASRLVSGTMSPHRELEERIREFKNKEAVLVFNSGYHANTGCIPALAGRGDEVFTDRLDHASIIDGCILSRAILRRYRNSDTNSLEGLLKRSKARRKVIITDGIFSMDGTIAPLRDILWLARRYDAILIVDDAHGVGVLGRNGRGSCEHLGVEDDPCVVEIGTLGKAFGCFGAFVAGSRDLIELLVNRARPFIYSTALPPAVCAGAVKAVEIVKKEPSLRERLFENIVFFREELKRYGLPVPEDMTQIIPIHTGSPERTVAISRRLLERGIFIQAIRPPTVPEHTSRLRITITAEHTRDDLSLAVRGIKETLDEWGYQ